MAFGTLFGIWFVGPGSVNPTNQSWTQYGDLRLAELHWKFFRNTEVFQWPIAGTPNYVRVEPHPILFHLPFKLLDPVLPTNFQFVGLALVLLFALQSLVGHRLLAYLGLKPVALFLGTAVLTLSPLLTYRTGFLSHTMLGGHFIVLWSILLYVKTSRSAIQWSAIAFVASTLDMYLFVIVMTILVATTVRFVLFSRERTFSNIGPPLLVPCVISVLSLWAQGFFVDPTSLSAVYTFRLNVASFINPHFGAGLNFSAILPRISEFFDRSLTNEEVEGFAYLGLGVIAGSILGIPYLFINTQKRKFLEYIPLFVVALVWLFIAFSSSFVVFRQEFLVPRIGLVESFRAIFRAGPRFAVLAYYLFAVAVIVGCSRVARVSFKAAALVLMLVVVQLVDIYPGINKSHQSISTAKEVSVRLTSSLWADLGNNFEHLVIYPAYDFHSDFNGVHSNFWIDEDRWFPLVQFAAESGMSSNFGYLSRENLEYTRGENQKTLNQLRKLDLAPCTIYAIPDSARSLVTTLGSRIMKIDGYQVVLGNNKGCKD